MQERFWRRCLSFLSSAALLCVGLPLTQSLSPSAEGSDVSETVIFAKCDGTEGGIFHPGGFAGSEREFLGTNPAYANNQRVMPAEPKDLSGCNVLTLELFFHEEYQAGYDVWKTHMSIQVVDNENHFASYPMPQDLVPGQFNTVTLDLDIARSAGLNLQSIAWVAIKSHPDGIPWMNDGLGLSYDTGWTNVDAPAFLFDIKNIVGRTEEREGQLIDPGYFRFWGTGCGNFNWVNAEYAFTPVDATGADLIEFDVYISDLESLREEKAPGNPDPQYVDLMFGIGASADNIRYASIGSQITQSGWTHVAVPVSQLGSDILGSLSYLRCFFENNAYAHAPSQNYTFGITNIRATTLEAPPLQSGDLLHSGGSVVWKAGTTPAYCNVEDWIFDKAWDFTDVDYLDFDIYVSDWESMQKVENFSSFVVWLRTSDEPFNNCYIGDYTSQIQGTGWNHIRLPLSAFTPMGSPDWSTVKSLRLYMEGNTTAVADKDYLLKYANFAAVTAEVRLSGIYGDNMLFAQNKPVNLAGTGAPGASFTVKLLEGGTVVEEKAGTVGTDGKWALSLEPRAGGYTAYELALYQNGLEIQRIRNVVFGELWLASGQSNMEFKMWETPEGDEMLDAGGDVFPNANVRILYTPQTYSAPHSATPLDEIPGSSWIVGNTQATHNVSAVAFWFADKLQRELDMPVGVLDASLGGTSIYAWMSRDSIEANTELKAYMQSKNKYVAAESWDSGCSHDTMTVCFNAKIAPLTVFNITGVIWYQGEGNIGDDDGVYTEALNTLLADWSGRFGFADSRMPFILTHIAPYAYQPLTVLPGMWEDMSDAWAQHPDTMAQVAIYDLPLDWDYSEWAAYGTGGDPIHPYAKKPVGERLAAAALGLVYGRADEYTAPVLKDTRIEDGAILLTFDHVGDGLAALDGGALHGFTICGSDGVYVNAQAEIISADTVKVWSAQIPEPAAAAYAYTALNTSANLSSTRDGEPLFLAVPLRTSAMEGAVYFPSQGWMDADEETVWHTIGVAPKEYDTWKALDGAEAAIDGAEKANGSGSLKITYTGAAFGVSPVLNAGASSLFSDQTLDFSRFKTLTFQIKNPGGGLKLSGVRIKNNTGAWYRAEIGSTGQTEAGIAAGSDWTAVTVNLNRLVREDSQAVYSSIVLNKVRDIQFCFEAEEGSGVLYLDAFSFGTAPVGEEPGPAEKEDILPVEEQLAGEWPQDTNNDWGAILYDTRDYPIDASGYQYVEFDYTVSDTAIYNYYTGRTGFRLSSSEEQPYFENWDFDFGPQVRDAQPGETVHVRVPLWKVSGVDLQHIRYIQFYIEAAEPQHPAFTRTISNLKFVTSVTPPQAADGTPLVPGGSVYWEKSQDGTMAEASFPLDNAADLSKLESLAFDVYVEDLAALKGAENFEALLVQLLSGDSSLQADITAQLKADGWNRIVLKKADFTGNGNWAAIDGVRIGLRNGSAVLSGKDNLLWFANAVYTEAAPVDPDPGEPSEPGDPSTPFDPDDPGSPGEPADPSTPGSSSNPGSEPSQPDDNVPTGSAAPLTAGILAVLSAASILVLKKKRSA